MGMIQKSVSSSELHRNTREVIDEVRVSGEPVVVENYGKPMVVVISIAAYEAYLRYQTKNNKADTETISG